MIMNVAVPLPKHSPIFGQLASSHTVCRLCSRRICLISEKRELPVAAFTRIHSGFFSFSIGMILIGMRAVLACAFCFAVASYAAGAGAASGMAGFAVTSVIRSIQSGGNDAGLRLGNGWGGRGVA